MPRGVFFYRQLFVFSFFCATSLIWQYPRQFPAFAMGEALNLLVVSDPNTRTDIQENKGNDEGSQHPRMLHGILNHGRHLEY